MDADELPLIMFRIPGRWASMDDLDAKLRAADTGYHVALDEVVDHAADERRGPGQRAGLVHAATGDRFDLGVVGADAEITSLFREGERLSNPELKALRRHTVKVVVGGPGGSVGAARAMLRAGAAVIRAGGLGVFVDNCGSTHSPTDWLELAGDDGDGGVYWALVDVAGGPAGVFSIGMHCLGRRDVELPHPTDPPGRTLFIVHSLLGYSYRAGVPLVDGDPIGPPAGPTHTLRAVECERFPPDTPFHNPYGVWRLEPFVVS